MKLLKGKVAIVTGASSGIGRAAARLFAEHGANVVVAARRERKLTELVEEIVKNGGSAKALAGDVRSETYANALVDLAVREFGELNIAFNNAGILKEFVDTTSVSLEDWNDTIESNLTSAFLGAKYQIPAMLNSGGSIIFTSSFVGNTMGMPQMAAYAASKAGIVGLTKSLASEFGTKAIRVNALLPGGTDTPMGDVIGDTPEVVEFVKNLHALKRTASPEEIAQSALYLAADVSSFTTGTAMLVDGGVSISKT